MKYIFQLEVAFPQGKEEVIGPAVKLVLELLTDNLRAIPNPGGDRPFTLTVHDLGVNPVALNLQNEVYRLQNIVRSDIEALNHWRKAFDEKVRQWKVLVTRLGTYVMDFECGHGVSFKEPCIDCGASAVFGDELVSMEQRVRAWVESRIGAEHMHPKERAMRLFEEACELAQAEGISPRQLEAQAEYVYGRPVGERSQEAGGVAVCLYGYAAAIEKSLAELASTEMARIEAKPLEEIRGSIARKTDADLVAVARVEKELLGTTHGAHRWICDNPTCRAEFSEYVNGCPRCADMGLHFSVRSLA